MLTLVTAALVVLTLVSGERSGRFLVRRRNVLFTIIPSELHLIRSAVTVLRDCLCRSFHHVPII